MIWRIIRSRGFIPALLILAALLYWRLHSPQPKVMSVGYVADRNIILWNTLAQVREPVGEVHYGDRVEILRMEGIAAQVRTVSGLLGWMPDSRQVMDSELWGKTTALLDLARTLPVQARGKTKTLSNVRVEPGRDAKRVFQFVRATPVLILKRAVSEPSQSNEGAAQEEKTSTSEEPAKPKPEDWLFVMRTADSPQGIVGSVSNDKGSATKPATPDSVGAGPEASQTASAANEPSGPVAGWVLARFIELDLPGAVKDYASSADLRVIAWFELNRVPDGSGGEAPQYLVAGNVGGEGQPCDFTMLRVYTLGEKRKRYETAYVESKLCGHLPIRVSGAPKGAEFHFENESDGENKDLRYVMQTTSVRRERDSSSAPVRHHRN